jgi:hypothetical protein
MSQQAQKGVLRMQFGNRFGMLTHVEAPLAKRWLLASLS